MMSDRGVALIVVLLVMMLLSALGLSLTMLTSTEERVADAYSSGSEAFYAADGALELAVHELSRIPDWSHVLDGTVTSSFVDPHVSLQEWPGGQAGTGAEATALVNCRRTSCTDEDMDARTMDRPWGENNPRWRLFAYGPVRNFSTMGPIDSSGYVAVWVGDDPSENDGRPLVDGDDSAGTNPGRGLLTLLVHAYGPSSRRAIEATVAQAGNGVRVLSWREVR
ncbi:MAG TPA: pilus assembly PilX N-terminal domain-containing protein [Vicinamibacterales bacterium]|nr:pilus assembly PilX N-terminal domain-containing protein [Vicinamibacterales bacterium]